MQYICDIQASVLLLYKHTSNLLGKDGPVGIKKRFKVCILISFYLQSIEELEQEMLNGQKLQGPLAALEVHKLLKEEKKEQE